MPEQIKTLYGKIAEGRNGILEMQFDSVVWEAKVDGSLLRVRRKGM